MLKIPLLTQFSDTARTVKVPVAGTEYNAGDTTTCSGWGTTTEGGLSPAIINYVEIPFVTDEGKCVSWTWRYCSM